MKILFLDVDGVLNCSITFRRHHDKIQAAGVPDESDDWQLNHLDEELVPRLNDIVEKTNCKIVLSSSWRIGCSLSTFTDWLGKKGFKYPEKVIGCTPVMPFVKHTRGTEIKTWLNKHSEVTAYAILDDDIEDILSLHPINTVRTDPREGLTSEKVSDVVLVLSR